MPTFKAHIVSSRQSIFLLFIWYYHKGHYYIYRHVLDFFVLKLKAPCNIWVKYTGTCLNTWHERVRHWATPILMLSFVRFLSVWKRAAHHFCARTNFLSWHKSETNLRTHSYTFTHFRTYTHAHTLTLWYSLSFFLSLCHTQSTIQVHIVRSNVSVSFQRFSALWWPYWLSTIWPPYWLSVLLMLTPKRWLDWFCSVPFFGDHLHLMRYNMAAVSKRSNLFLFSVKQSWRKLYCIVKIQLLKICLSLSVCLCLCIPPLAPIHTTVGACIVAGGNIHVPMGDNMCCECCRRQNMPQQSRSTLLLSCPAYARLHCGILL